MKDSVRHYYENIFKAEQFLIEGKKDSAIISYLNGMSFMYLMPNDNFFNVRKLISSTDNQDLAFKYYETVFRYTVDSLTPIEFVERFQNLISSEMQSRLLAELPVVIKTPFLFIDENHLKISSILSPLRDADQAYRDPLAGNSKSTIKHRKNGDIENFKSILKCYKTYGSFNTMRLDGEASSAFRMTLLHRFFDKKTRTKYNDFFVNEVRCGHIDSREYAGIVDNYLFDSTQVYGVHTIFFVGDSLVVFHLSDLGKEQINKNRQLIYLQDIETTQSKLIWQWKNNDEYRFETIWEIVPYYPTETASDVAKQKLKKMGSLVTGYTIYAR